MDTAGVLQGAGIAESRAASDPKCKLSISSFLTLPYLLDCLICATNIMIFVLLLQMMCAWESLWVVHLCYGLGRRTEVGIMVFLFFVLFFFLLLIVLSWLIHDSSCVCIIASFLLSLSLVSLTRHY